jgi:hypothetical protein
MRQRRAVLLGLLLLLVAGLLGGCGGGDDDESAEPSASASADADVDADADADVGDLFNSSRCAREVQRMAEAQAAALQAVTGNVDTVEEAADAFEEMADAAPSEIKDDMRILAEVYTEYGEIVAESNFDPSSGQPPSSEALEKLQEASEKFNDERFTEASERVSKWFQEECGR